MRIGVVFPGQGSQSVGMGGALAERFSAGADLFARAERVLGYDLLEVITRGPAEKLRETRYGQPAIFVTNYALAVCAGPDFPVVASAGHSFGEFCSLTLAGALQFEDALALVDARAKAMQEAAERAPGAMAAILGLDAAGVRAAVDAARPAGVVQLANYNAPGQIVVSGEREAVERAGELALAGGAKRVVPLNVSGAWHSELMAEARVAFAPFIARAVLELPRFTVVSNVDAQPYRDLGTIRTNLVRSVTDEVLWHATSERLIAEGLDLLVEFGGSAVLAPLLKRVAGSPPVVHAGDPAGLEKLGALLASGSAA